MLEVSQGQSTSRTAQAGLLCAGGGQVMSKDCVYASGGNDEDCENDKKDSPHGYAKNPDCRKGGICGWGSIYCFHHT